MSSVSARAFSPAVGGTRRRGRVWVAGVVFVAVAASATGCSPGSLTGMGGASSDWIEGSADEPVLRDLEAELVPAAQVSWWNDDLGETVEARAVVLAAVAGRRAGEERLLHASRWEIAAVLPEIRFPAVVPASVESLTSLLVLDSTRPELATDQVAEFEMWTAEPYTRSRQSGEVATLSVSPAVGGVDTGCTLKRAPECVETDVGGMIATRTHADDGDTWVWRSGGYRYELFVRADYSYRAAEMVAGMVPLAEIAGSQATAGLPGTAG